METQVRTLDENALVDLFGGNQNPLQSTGFGMSEMPGVDILGANPPTPPPADTNPNNPTPPPPAEEEKKEGDEPKEESDKSPDILGQEHVQAKPGRKPKYDFSDISGYFEDRLKAGKFVKIEEEDESGEKKLFIPKTPEEFDEVIDIQVNYKLEQAKKELEESWYKGKSPAWQAISRYAEMVDDPTQLIPFLQGVRTIQSVQSINEEEIDGAEQIVRARMEQRGEPSDVIESQIEALKTTDKLISTAKLYKPLIVQEEQQALAQEAQARQRQEQDYIQMVSQIRESAIKAIEAPIFGKQKLKQDEKAAVYELIAQPSEEAQGYRIYSEIDNLFQKGDFETLKQVALLLSKKDSFYNYMGLSSAEKTADKLEKKLRVAGEKASSGKDLDAGDDDQPVVQRNQFSKVPRFGR